MKFRKKESQKMNLPAEQNRDNTLERTLRPEWKPSEIAFRARDVSPVDRQRMRKALQTLHSLELMAVNIYRAQITAKETELNRHLIAAMCNEMTHVQDFQTRLFEHGFRPSLFRWIWWTVGLVFGTVSRLRGPRAILKMGIWVESKAVTHYAELLTAAPWDDPTRATLARDAEDEQHHINTWKQLLAKLTICEI